MDGRTVTPVSETPAGLRAACEAPCSSTFTTVHVWLDADEAPRLYVRESDPGECSHAPTLYFDAAGTQVGAVPMEPVVAGSERALALTQIHEEQVAGLHLGTATRCAPSGAAVTR